MNFFMRAPELTVSSPDTDWLPGTVAELADALGWPVTWTAAADSPQVSYPLGTHFEVSDGDQLLGRLTVEAPDDERLDAAHESICGITKVFAQALNRAATSSRTARSRSFEISTLIDAVKSIPQTSDLRSAVGHLLRVCVQLTGLYSAAFFLYDPRNDHLRLRATHQLPARSVPQNLRAVDITTPDGRLVNDACVMLDRHRLEDDPWLPAQSAVGLSVPVQSDGYLIGTLWCFDRRQRSLGEWEVQVLQSVAAQLASMLERTMLLEESARQRELSSELEYAARKLPVGLMQPPPAEWGVDVAIRAATVTGVGGDICDVIPLDGRRTLIAIGDAVGHSVPAAMLVSVARGALRALIAQTSEHRITVEGLTMGINRALHAVTQSEQFVTLLIGILDADAGTFTYTNAGHPPPLLLRNGEWQSLKTHGLFLGFAPETNYTATTVGLKSRDVLAAFTDGVIETMNAEKVLFRRQGVMQPIPAADEASAEAIAETIWGRLLVHHGDGPLKDDRTLLVMKYQPGM